MSNVCFEYLGRGATTINKDTDVLFTPVHDDSKLTSSSGERKEKDAATRVAGRDFVSIIEHQRW